MKNIALIGVGKMGLSHLAIANMTPGIHVTAICDTSIPLMHLLKKTSKINTFRDYRKMINQVDLDAVLISVPNSMHFEIARYCMERQIHVFIEKPLTLTYDQSAALAELAKKNNIKGQVGYVNRFNPIFKRIKKLLNEGVLGEIKEYQNRMIGNVITKENSKGWRNDYTKGGGCLFDYGPHCFDLSTYFFGNDVKVQSASLKRIFSTEVDDEVEATFLHNDTITGTNYINWSDNSVRKASNSIEIIGQTGKIYANKQEAAVVLDEERPDLNLKKGLNSIYITDESTDTEYYLRGEDFSYQLQDFSDLINDKIDCSISSLESASSTDYLIENVYKMAVTENGR